MFVFTFILRYNKVSFEIIERILQFVFAYCNGKNAMRTSKKQVTYRLPDTTIKQLAELAERYQVSQSVVISVVIHAAYNGLNPNELDKHFEIARLS